MSESRAEKLIEKLIKSKLTGNELSEIFDGLKDETQRQRLSDALEVYFSRLVEENEHEVESKICSKGVK